jgi:GNAT superfamily N-acetyltransferase
MPYNPPYYESFLSGYGFERSMTMWAYFVHKKYLKTAKLDRGAGLVLRRWPDLSVRTLDLSRFDEEARTILDIYNEAWSENWGHVPMTDAEFGQLAKELKQIVDPDMVVIIEDSGHPVAFAVSLPDINVALNEIPSGRLLPTGILKLIYLIGSDVIDHIRMPLMGVRKAYQGRGLDAVLIDRTIKNGIPKGLVSCELSWVLDTNKRLINALESLGAVVDKEYALFDATI